MPLYEYQCQECGQVREELQRFDDPPLTECKECGGTLRKLVSAPAFQFKGSGWYVTDYAGKGKGGDTKDGSSGSAKGSSDGADKGAAKSADKPAKKAASASAD